MKTNPAARNRARRFAMQAYYQMQMTGDSALLVEHQFLTDHDTKRVDTEFFHDLMSGISKDETALLASIETKLDRDFKEIDPIEKAILLIGAFELKHRIDIPYKVAIFESVEMAKEFGANESFKYVNSILDGLAKEFRQTESARG